MGFSGSGTGFYDVIELNELFSFYRHPQRYFMQRQMDVRFNGIEAEAEEREPFAIDKMAGYSIYHEWIQESLNGALVSVKKLQAQGRWLSGVLGELEFDRQQEVIKEFAGRIRAKNMGEPFDDLPIDIKIKGYRLIGKLTNRYKNGSLFYRYADLKGKDFICAWLHHLIINQVQEQTTFLLSTDEDLILLPDYCQPTLLSAFLDIFHAGNNAPNAFFVEAALAYIKQAHKLENGNRASKSALDVAKEQLSRAIQQPYEPELKRLYHNVTDMTQVLGETFEQHCQILLQPVWNATHR